MSKTESPSFLQTLSQDDQQSRKCELSRSLESMDPAMAAEVKTALADPTTNKAAIARTMTKLGYPISEGQVRRCHRTCSCWRA